MSKIMSAEMKIDLFEKLALKDWYKYLLYVSGIMLVLAIFLDTKIEQSKVIDFSMWTIGISLFTWFVDTVFTTVSRYYYIQRERDQPLSEGEKASVACNLLIQCVILLIWIALVTPKLF